MLIIFAVIQSKLDPSIYMTVHNEVTYRSSRTTDETRNLPELMSRKVKSSGTLFGSVNLVLRRMGNKRIGNLQSCWVLEIIRCSVGLRVFVISDQEICCWNLSVNNVHRETKTKTEVWGLESLLTHSASSAQFEAVKAKVDYLNTLPIRGSNIKQWAVFGAFRAVSFFIQ